MFEDERLDCCSTPGCRGHIRRPTTDRCDTCGQSFPLPPADQMDALNARQVIDVECPCPACGRVAVIQQGWWNDLPQEHMLECDGHCTHEVATGETRPQYGPKLVVDPVSGELQREVVGVAHGYVAVRNSWTVREWLTRKTKTYRHVGPLPPRPGTEPPDTFQRLQQERRDWAAGRL